MRRKLRETTKEALSAVLPITIIVFFISVFVSPMPVGTLLLFLFGALMLIVGMGLFTMGADMSMMPMGEDIGVAMTRTKKLIIIGACSLAIGFIITMAEPDLLILAGMIHNIPETTIILTVSIGVGVFLLLAIFRIVFRISLGKLLAVCYIAAIILALFSEKNFMPMAFDTGGVTTGPISVPFILAMGLGLASIRGDKDSTKDSFGLVALCSIGPILAVLALGFFYKSGESSYTPAVIPVIATSRDVTLEFAKNLPQYFKEVFNIVWPLAAILLVFQIITRRYKAIRLIRIFIGLIYTFLGMALFLTGVNIGFIPVGQSLGASISATQLRWLLIPLGALVGYFVVAAEPAVHVMRKRVEEASAGTITAVAVQRYVSVGVAAAGALSMLRVLTGIPLNWFLLPVYSVAVVLTFITPKLFIGVAFDCGGVVSGPMTATFLLPIAIGACGDSARIMTDAFGLIALVAAAPLVSIQLMGIIYKGKITAGAQTEKQYIDDEIIDFAEEAEDDIVEFEIIPETALSKTKKPADSVQFTRERDD